MTRTDQDFKSRLINMLKVVQTVKDLPSMQETQVLSLVQEEILEQGMISLSSIAWRVLWSEEPGRLQSMGSQRVARD